VVGFAVSQATSSTGATIDCASLTPSDLTSATGICAQNPSSALKACCTLNRIAYNGGTTNAYFASTVDGLRSGLSEILSRISKGSTSRTVPVFASATTSGSGSTSFRFFTSFKPNTDGSGLWQGVIERQRYVCDGVTTTPQPKTVDPSFGDDFVANVNAAGPSQRKFYSVSGQLDTTSIYSTRSIRTQPTLASADGAGDYTGTQVSGDLTTFPGVVLPAAMNISATPCMGEVGAQLNSCRDRYLKWLIGGDNGTTYQRCQTTGVTTCNLIADIYHSVPVVVGNPNENLRDEGYQLFARGAAVKRPLVLYTSTNDGLLHAFKVASNDPADAGSKAARVEVRTNNELWAFIPPAVLPRIPSEYPNVHQLLLDGAPVVKDVAGTTPTTGTGPLLERDVKTISTSNSEWHTILVQSFGGSYSGYFALDITDPVAGPKFLWQLTTDKAGNALFGDAGGTPTIATLFFDPNNSGTAREIAVAILPGGNGGALPSASIDCDRADKTPAVFDSTTMPRTKVPCYTDDASNDRSAARRARSITIVRLDTGEIIRTFRQSTADAPASIAGRVTSAKIDSPITGQPVAYPGWTGAIADRAYVGDRDGTLWRLDFSSTSPAQWNMQIFFDAYRGKGSHVGQPIATTPVVSTNDNGQVVVLFSTGSQEDLLGTAGTENFVYSLYEQTNVVTSAGVTTIAVTPKVNWYLDFTGGKRATGPITLFASNAYFSTYTPPADAHACDAGSSSLWGVHYVNPKDPYDLSKGGVEALPKDGLATSTDKVQEIVAGGPVIAAGSTIFGVGIAQVQGCYTQGDAITDPYFGTSYNPIAAASSPDYQIVVQTGLAGTSSSGGTTKSTTISLPRPNVSPRVNGWAMVTE
jgi:type IV pilus assembly protein PilY1